MASLLLPTRPEGTELGGSGQGAGYENQQPHSPQPSSSGCRASLPDSTDAVAAPYYCRRLLACAPLACCLAQRACPSHVKKGLPPSMVGSRRRAGGRRYISTSWQGRAGGMSKMQWC